MFQKTTFLFCILIIVSCFNCFSISASGEEVNAIFTDPNDGMFDVSDWLLKQRGFLPAPMIITEPAVGYGGGATLMFFHEQKQDRESENGSEKFGLPPSITSVVGAATENRTWFTGIYHSGSWMQDRIRYLGYLGKASVNLTFYGGGESPILPGGVDYNLNGWFTGHSLLFRMQDSDLFLGGKLSYFDLKSKFKFPNLPPGIQEWELDFRSAGIGPQVKYD